MTFNTVIPKKLKKYFDDELRAFEVAFNDQNLIKAWNHLERAHIIGQKYPYQHTLVHWKMLVFGIKIKSSKEVIGQIPRLLAGGVKSFVGKVPIGNPGGANVPPLKPFSIDNEILEIFNKAGI